MGLELLGVSVMENEKDSYQKLWKYVGYYLGEFKKETFLFIVITIQSPILKVHPYTFDGNKYLKC